MASANTPTRGEPISLLDVRRVFGYGNNTIPGDDLSDYYDIPYYDTRASTFYAKGKFQSSGEIDLEDFYDKSSVDPITPGKFEDYDPGGPRYVTLPAFRNFVVIDVWGAGGGGGAGDHDGMPAAAASGGASYIQTKIGANTFIITSNGGGGGLGGYRYGDQSGAGGGGGSFSNTGVVVGTFKARTAGTSGQGGNAGEGRGGNGGSAPEGGDGGARGGSREGPNNPINGKPGGAPGGGGGGGGSSDFQSGKNANPNRAAGGGGGSGAYQRLYLTRAQITPGTQVIYSVGAGGAGRTVPPGRSLGNGAAGGAGGFRLYTDKTDEASINYSKIVISEWEYQFAGCYIGWNDLVLYISSSPFTVGGVTTGSSGGIALSVTGAAADYGVANPGFAGQWKPSGHTVVANTSYIYKSNIMLNGSPLQDYTSPWWSAYSAGRDNTSFRIITNWNSVSGTYSVSVEASGKGGDSTSRQLVKTITPTLTWLGI
jgi:hypothetical protein